MDMWMVLISTCGFFTLVMSLAFCLCWKKKQSNSELTGIDGLVIKKNPDENVNHLPPTDVTVVDGISNGRETNRKTVPQANTRRSLPDIPFEHDNVNWEIQIDNSSEHYATVEQFQNSMKRHTLPNGIEVKPSISQHSSLSQADFSPYERVKYDKIKSREHPYAQLQPANGRSTTLESKNVMEEPGPSQRSEPAFSEADATRRNSGEHNLDIPAASAVAGGIAASPELPYMTPPVPHTNFSGDSQDSSKGYTSISVREPLANIIAQTKETIKKRELDPHYSTVSDDSDDVYTTIPDPNQVYTSESETYARIPPAPIIVEAEINQCAVRSDSDENTDGVYEPPPQPVPPSVDSLKHVAHSKTHTHSRQASSSSTANIGSPKPEKRQANSPLPLLPTVTTDGDKRTTIPRNIDDLYAKVQKNKLKSNSDEEKSPEKQFDTNPCASTSNIEDKRGFKVRKNLQEHSYEILEPIDPDYEKIKHDEPGYASINGSESLSNSDPGYEVLRGISELDPNYEELKHASEIGYSKIEKNNDVLFGYSVVNKKKKSDKSRNFEVYDSNSQDDALDENNYESMPSESISEFHYTGLKSSGSETDPNYESVSHLDPNYESVKYLDDEPPYEKVDNNSIITDSEIPGYERINSRGYENIDTSESSDSAANKFKRKKENPYEKLSTDMDLKVKNSNLGTKSSSLESSSSIKSEDFVKDDIIDNSGNILDDNVIFEV